MEIILWIVFSLLFFAILLGWIFARIVIFPKRFGVQESYDLEKNDGKLVEKEYSSWEMEEVWLPSKFGYSIYGLYFPIKDSKRSLIFSHGITYTLYGSVKYMKIFRELGFNVFIYDNRYHGSSGGKNCTFGFTEKYDLTGIITWLKQKVGEDSIIGLHGESMGAAISLQTAEIDNRLSFVVSDCCFSDLSEQLAYRLKVEYHLPKFPTIPFASLMSKIMSGFEFKYVSPIKSVRKITAPVLFIHGSEDDFIPVSMAHALYAQKSNGARKLFIAPNAKHAESYWCDPAAYTRVVNEFLKENNII